MRVLSMVFSEYFTSGLNVAMSYLNKYKEKLFNTGKRPSILLVSVKASAKGGNTLLSQYFFVKSSKVSKEIFHDR